jgi:hypothetical protein
MNTYPLSARGRDRAAAPAELRHPLSGAPLPDPAYGPCVITRYLNGKVRASHKRSQTETTRAVVAYDHGRSAAENHRRAVLALLVKLDGGSQLEPVACGHDADAYFHVLALRRD